MRYIKTFEARKTYAVMARELRSKLIGRLKDDMKQLLLNISFKSDFEIEVFENDIDLYILSITSIVRKLKQKSIS